MKVLLINPYIRVRDDQIRLSEPLGLLCLATYAKSALGPEVQIEILDLYAEGLKKASPKISDDGFITKGESDPSSILQKIRSINPALVGITSCFTGYFKSTIEIANLIKSSFPEIHICLGGAHATLDAKKIIESNQCVDSIVLHEGEETFLHLVTALKGNAPLSSVNGIAYREASSNAVAQTPPRPLIKDISELPIPDRNLIDMDFYKNENTKLFNFARKSPIATIMTSRGCPYKCVFCCTKNMWLRRWRDADLDNVFAEIKGLVERYRIREFVILDDQFVLSKERIHQFCDRAIELNLKVSFSNIAGVSAWLINDTELLKKMRKAGFYKITIPIESGNQETLKFITKPVKLDQVDELIKKANRLGYWTGAFFIVGFPYETRSQIEETINYAYRTDLDFAHFFVAQPYIGTELYEVYRSENLLPKQQIDATYLFKGWNDTIHMKAEELNAIVESAQGGWLKHKISRYLKPRNFASQLLPKFRAIDDIVYALKIFTMLVTTKINTRMAFIRK